MTAKLKTDRISSLADRDCWLDWLTTTPQTWWAWTEHTQTYRHIYTQTDRDSQVPSMSNDKPKPNHTVRPRVTDVCLSHRLCVHVWLCVSMPVSQTVSPHATVMSQYLSHELCISANHLPSDVNLLLMKLTVRRSYMNTHQSFSL